MAVFEKNSKLAQNDDIELFCEAGSRAGPGPRITQDLLTKTEVRFSQDLKTKFMIGVEMRFVEEHRPFADQVAAKQEGRHRAEHVAAVSE